MESKSPERLASSEVASTADSTYPLKEHLKDPDLAYSFLSNVNNSRDVASVDLSKLRRKIDWYIVPIMFLCYTMQFIDKVSLNVSPPGVLPCAKLSPISMQR